MNSSKTILTPLFEINMPFTLSTSFDVRGKFRIFKGGLNCYI